MPHNNNKPELIELLINEEINNQQVNTLFIYVEVINRARHKVLQNILPYY